MTFFCLHFQRYWSVQARFSTQ